MPPLLAAFCFLPLLLMLSSVFRLLRLHRHLIVALYGHQLMQPVAFFAVIVVVRFIEKIEKIRIYYLKPLDLSCEA